MRYIGYILLLTSIYGCGKPDIQVLTHLVQLPTTYTINDICAIHDSLIYIAGGSRNTAGYTAHSIDRGEHWGAIDSIIGREINCLWSLTDSKLLVGGDYGIWLSTDSGHHYPTQVLNIPTAIHRIVFSDGLHGWAVAGSGYTTGSIYHTADGGLNWSLSYTDTLHSFNGICIHDSLTIIAVGYGTIVRSADAGLHWQIVRAQGDIYQSVRFIDKSIAIAIGYQGEILRSTDAGMSWVAFKSTNGLFDSPDYFLALDFANSSIGYAVGEAGLMMGTTDGGLSWARVKPFTDRSLRAIHLWDTHHATLVGEDGKVWQVSGL